MFRIFCGDDLAERAAGVVPDQGDRPESKRRQKVRNQTSQPERAAIRVRVERHIVRTERPVWYDTLERDPARRELLSAILAYPGVPKRWGEPNFESPQDVIIPIAVRLGDQTLRFFSTISTLGSPHDITLQELRIEAFHPADEVTADIARSVAARIEL
jgi:hypothetical protein